MRNVINLTKNYKQIIEDRKKDPKIREAEELEAKAKELRKAAVKDEALELRQNLLRAIELVENLEFQYSTTKRAILDDLYHAESIINDTFFNYRG